MAHLKNYPWMLRGVLVALVLLIGLAAGWAAVNPPAHAYAASARVGANHATCDITNWTG